jgi:hypothetical protein
MAQTTPPTGFTVVRPDIKKRMICSVEGDWGTGKTDFALTAPGPIAFFKFDLNSDFTLAKYAKTKKIYKREYEVIDPSEKNAKAKADEVVRTFTADYRAVIACSEIRSIVWDTATEIWEQVRLAAFGKLAQVLPHHYVEVNNSFRGLIREAYDSDTNLILVHRLKDEWTNYTDAQGKEKSKKTGRKERAGFSDLGFAVQVMVQTLFSVEESDSPFSLKVLKCTQNPLLTERLYAQVGEFRANSFAVLAADIFNTGLEEWQ